MKPPYVGGIITGIIGRPIMGRRGPLFQPFYGAQGPILPIRMSPA